MKRSGLLTPDQQARVAAFLSQGQTHHQQGRLAEAEAAYRAALAIDPENVDATHLLGVVAQQVGDLPESIRLISKASQARPNNTQMLVNLGAAYRKHGQFDEAIRAYERALSINSQLAEAHFNLGQALCEKLRFDEAEVVYERAIKLKPNDADTYVNLGIVYKAQGRQDDALNAFEQAHRLNPNKFEPLDNMSAVFRDMAFYFSAIAASDKALSINPLAHTSRLKKGLIELQVGLLSEGWRDYDCRFLTADWKDMRKRPLPPVYWDGEDLTGRTLLVWPEQGQGDQIIFGSTYPDLVLRAQHCIFLCKDRLAPIFARSFPSATVLTYDPDNVSAGLEDNKRPDYQIAAGSLGRILRRDFKSFPRHQGYLKADPTRRAELRARYMEQARGRRIVGLAWRSKSPVFGAEKSADLANWSRILKTPGVMFVNLQYGDCTEDLAAVKETLGVEIVHDASVDPLKDMEGCFAQTAAMDLVISTSNTAVHVAGAQSIPCWVLLPRGLGSLWYWLLEREDNPWYPSLRLFRERAEEWGKGPWWSGVVERVGQAFERWAEGR